MERAGVQTTKTPNIAAIQTSTSTNKKNVCTCLVLTILRCFLISKNLWAKNNITVDVWGHVCRGVKGGLFFASMDKGKEKRREGRKRWIGMIREGERSCRGGEMPKEGFFFLRFAPKTLAEEGK